MVIYFTGTGNSQYVAEALADQLKDEVVCSNDMIKKGETGKFESERPWVFVFPTYLSTIARIFAEFIEKSEFRGSPKAYFVATCAKAAGAAPNYCIELCKSKQLEYMGMVTVQMPQNYIALFSMTEPEECKRRIAAAIDAADAMSAKISNQEPFDRKAVSGIEYNATKWVEKLYYGKFTKTKKFFATENCVGCGICVNACPLNNIKLTDGKPQWLSDCIHCMACINRCPKQAIEYGKNTAGKKRYLCEKYKKEYSNDD